MTVRELYDLKTNGHLRVVDGDGNELFSTEHYNPLAEYRVENMVIKKWGINNNTIIFEVESEVET